MLENPTDAPSVKRYAPPSQRNRVLNRRKSGDRFERVNYAFGNDGEKGQLSSKNIPGTYHGDSGSSNLTENSHPRLIPLDGCCSSEAVQLLNERWAAATHSYNDPSIDLSERPIMYTGASGSAWGHTKLPPQMDFLAELRSAIQNANAGMTMNVADRN